MIFAIKSKKLFEGDIKKSWSDFGNPEKYHSISKIVCQEKDGFAIVIAIAKYDKRNVQFILTYDKNMKLEGIYFK